MTFLVEEHHPERPVCLPGSGSLKYLIKSCLQMTGRLHEQATYIQIVQRSSQVDGGSNSISKFEVGDSPIGFDMIYLSIMWLSRGRRWTVGKVS